MPTIVCYGDSNTHGFDAATMGRFPRDVRWPGVLAAELGGIAEVDRGGPQRPDHDLGRPLPRRPQRADVPAAVPALACAGGRAGADAGDERPQVDLRADRRRRSPRARAPWWSRRCSPGPGRTAGGRACCWSRRRSWAGARRPPSCGASARRAPGASSSRRCTGRSPGCAGVAFLDAAPVAAGGSRPTACTSRRPGTRRWAGGRRGGAGAAVRASVRRLVAARRAGARWRPAACTTSRRPGRPAVEARRGRRARRPSTRRGSSASSFGTGRPLHGQHRLPQRRRAPTTSTATGSCSTRRSCSPARATRPWPPRTRSSLGVVEGRPAVRDRHRGPGRLAATRADAGPVLVCS